MIRKPMPPRNHVVVAKMKRNVLAWQDEEGATQTDGIETSV